MSTFYGAIYGVIRIPRKSKKHFSRLLKVIQIFSRE